MIGDYKGTSGDARMASLGKAKDYRKKNGFEIYPKRCSWCDQREGILQFHNFDYDIHPCLFSVGLCWRCHQMYHSFKHVWARNQVEQYFIKIHQGYQWPPVFKHDYGVLARDHGVGSKLAAGEKQHPVMRPDREVNGHQSTLF